LKFFIIFFITVYITLLHASLNDHFVSTWKTDNPGTSNSSSITIPTAGLGYAYQVDWNNDGDFLDADETTVYHDDITHDFGVAGTYTIRISGRFPRIYFNNGGDKEKILSIEQWGTIQWKSMGRAFYGAKNLAILATDTPDFSAVTDMQYMFNGATRANPDTTFWDTSSVRNMRYMFARTAMAAPTTTFWDTSQVTNMSYMFYLAAAANPDTSHWDTGNVTSMRSMFRKALLATPDTASWNTAAVTDMALMFRDAPLANPDTGSWDLTNVSDLSYMFYKATAAKPDTTSWNTASVTNMRNLFSWAAAAKPDTSHWNTGNVTKMQYMFYKATAADPDATRWNIGNVTDMSAMFTDITLATPRYDALLLAFDAQNVQNGVTFHGGNSTYCSSAEARKHLMTTYGWNITDGGIDCRPITPTQAPNLQESSDSGSSATDNNTSNRTLIFDLPCLRIGNTLSLYSDYTMVATHTCTTLDVVEVTANQLTLGTHKMTYTDANITHESLHSPELNVTIYNNPPVATDNHYTLYEDTRLYANVIGDAVTDSDIDGDLLHIISYSTPLHGTLSIENNGTLTYIPHTDFYGSDTFRYRIGDGNGGEADALVSLTVIPRNDAPVIAEGNNTQMAINEDTILTTLLHADDRDGDPLYWNVQSPATHGNVHIENTGNTPVVSYTPQADYFGNDHFEIRVSDANASDTITFFIHVAPLNDLPVAVNDVTSSYDGHTVTLDVLGNDYDVDHDTLSLESTSIPTYGSAIIAGDVIVYTAPHNLTATDTFTYTIRDANGGSATASVSIAVTTMDRDGIEEAPGLDNNHNGKDDRFESHVATQSFESDFITLAVQSSATIHDMRLHTNPITTTLNDGSTIIMPFGTIAFKIIDINEGGNALIALYYPKNEQIQGYAKRLEDGSWHLLESQVTHTDTQTVIRFSITDGSPFDLDTVPAQITDPGGAYYQAASPVTVPISPLTIIMIVLLLFLQGITTLHATRKRRH